MDVKTLSTIIGHVSSSSLNIYAHVTDERQRTAASKIDQGIGKKRPKRETETAPQNLLPAPLRLTKASGANPSPAASAKSTITCGGRYFPIWPGGKKHAHNVYAKTREECEQLVTELIEQMKAEIAAEKERLQQKEKTG